MTPFLVIFGIYFVMSLITFILFWVDKRRSMSGGWRIAEYYLHLSELLGGWPGALMGQKFIRHKTKKWSYILVLWGIIAVHAFLWVYFLYGLSTKIWW